MKNKTEKKCCTHHQFSSISGVKMQKQQPEQENPDFPLLRYPKDTEEPRDAFPLASPWSAPGLLLDVNARNTSQGSPN